MAARLPSTRWSRKACSEEEARFILDNHLGKLAASLRMLGFDTLYRNDYQDDELAATAAAEQRILLTRDRRLLMRKVIPRGYCVRPDDPQQQIRAVLHRYNLYRQVRPFQRCLRCNHPLQPVAKAEVFERLEPLTKLYFDEFSICPSCNQVYWEGSHYDTHAALIADLVKDSTCVKIIPWHRALLPLLEIIPPHRAGRSAC